MAKVKTVLLFNRKTRVLIGTLDPNLDLGSVDQDRFITKTVDMDPEEYYYGDYDNGKIYHPDDKPYISEKNLKFFATQDIQDDYPLHKQINIICDMLKQSGIPQTPEFQKMLEAIEPVRERVNQQIKAYASTNAFAFLSNEEDQELVKKRYDF